MIKLGNIFFLFFKRITFFNFFNFSNFLYQISRGIDNEPVESRIIPKSIGSCKSFPLGLKNKNEIQNWLSILMKDVFDKLEVDCKKVCSY